MADELTMTNKTIAAAKCSTVHDLLCDSLQRNGYDGLCSDECGCALEDLCPCGGECVYDCSPAFMVPCRPEDCEVGGGCDYHFGPEQYLCVITGEAAAKWRRGER